MGKKTGSDPRYDHDGIHVVDLREEERHAAEVEEEQDRIYDEHSK